MAYAQKYTLLTKPTPLAQIKSIYDAETQPKAGFHCGS
jgi:hypothetical protein